MSTSAFNLLPWRERLRWQTMRRWRWGLLLSLLVSAMGVQWLDHVLDAAWQQQLAQRQSWQDQTNRLQTALADAPLWAQRQQDAERVKAQWRHWQDRQHQAWQVLRQVLAVPPRGVQIEQVVWRDQQLQLTGWAISAAHLQPWQDQLPAQRVDWQPQVWRETHGWGWRQHRFGLTRQEGGGT